MDISEPITNEINPWRAVILNGQEYLLNFSLIGNSYKLMISDLQIIYEETVEEEDLKSKCKILNPALQASSSRILKEVKYIIDELVGIKVHNSKNSILSVMEKTETFLELKAESKLFEIPFVWCFSLAVADYSKIFTTITKPLICMTAELQRRERQLIKIIKKKDIEIDDYKVGGAKVSRTYLETQPFSENDFFSEMNKFEDIVDTVKNSVTHVFGKEKNILFSLVVAASNSISEQDSCNDKPSEMVTENKNVSHEPVKTKEALNKELEIERRKQLEKQLADAEERKKAKRKKKLNL